MSTEFTCDAFLSHSAKDKAVVRSIAERLRQDWLKVWFYEWEIKPGDNIPAKIEEGLENSRPLMHCMSGNVFGSDWEPLEAGTCRRGNFPFRDPLNLKPILIPVRLDGAPIGDRLEPFLCIGWFPNDRKQEFPEVSETCSPTSRSTDISMET